MKKKAFDLLTLGEILLRLSPPDNERIVRGEIFPWSISTTLPQSGSE